MACIDYQSTDSTITCSPYGYAMYASDYSYRDLSRILVFITGRKNEVYSGCVLAEIFSSHSNYPSKHEFLNTIYLIIHPIPAPPPRMAHCIRAPPERKGKLFIFQFVFKSFVFFNQLFISSFFFIINYFRYFFKLIHNRL